MSIPVKAIANLNDEENAVKGSNSKSRRHHHSYYTPAFKLEAVKFAKQTSYELAREKFQVHRQSVRRWHKSEEELKRL
jgi:transposase-like protein